MHWRIRYSEEQGIHEHPMLSRTIERLGERKYLRKTILHSPLVF